MDAQAGGKCHPSGASLPPNKDPVNMMEMELEPKPITYEEARKIKPDAIYASISLCKRVGIDPKARLGSYNWIVRTTLINDYK